MIKLAEFECEKCKSEVVPGKGTREWKFAFGFVMVIDEHGCEAGNVSRRDTAVAYKFEFPVMNCRSGLSCRALGLQWRFVFEEKTRLPGLLKIVMAVLVLVLVLALAQALVLVQATATVGMWVWIGVAIAGRIGTGMGISHLILFLCCYIPNHSRGKGKTQIPA